MGSIFEAVYYSAQVPDSYESLTLLSLIFDKIYFPGVYIPLSGVDEVETIKEIERIRSLDKQDFESTQILNCMIYALNMKYLSDFCVFTGKPGTAGILERGASELAYGLEELIFGPPPAGFTPTLTTGFAKGLPGDKTASINGPGWIAYPANAIMFAINNDVMIVNDNPTLPFPSIGGVSFKSNARALTTVLAFESVRLVLPQLKALHPKELAEFRQETNDLIKPFRLSMLKLSKELNGLITSDSSITDIQREAKFLADTIVLPELEELRRIIMEPSKPWYRRVVDFGKSVPELVGNFITMPHTLAVSKALVKFAELLADVHDEQLKKDENIKRGGFHFLLKIESRLKRNFP